MWETKISYPSNPIWEIIFLSLVYTSFHFEWKTETQQNDLENTMERQNLVDVSDVTSCEDKDTDSEEIITIYKNTN